MVPVIENIVKRFAFVFDAILKCPFRPDVLALIVVIKFDISLLASSNSCKKRLVAVFNAIWLNLTLPDVMPLVVVDVEYV